MKRSKRGAFQKSADEIANFQATIKSMKDQINRDFYLTRKSTSYFISLLTLIETDGIKIIKKIYNVDGNKNVNNQQKRNRKPTENISHLTSSFFKAWDEFKETQITLCNAAFIQLAVSYIKEHLKACNKIIIQIINDRNQDIATSSILMHKGKTNNTQIYTNAFLSKFRKASELVITYLQDLKEDIKTLQDRAISTEDNQVDFYVIDEQYYQFSQFYTELTGKFSIIFTPFQQYNKNEMKSLQINCLHHIEKCQFCLHPEAKSGLEKYNPWDSDHLVRWETLIDDANEQFNELFQSLQSQTSYQFFKQYEQSLKPKKNKYKINNKNNDGDDTDDDDNDDEFENENNKFTAAVDSNFVDDTNAAAFADEKKETEAKDDEANEQKIEERRKRHRHSSHHHRKSRTSSNMENEDSNNNKAIDQIDTENDGIKIISNEQMKTVEVELQKEDIEVDANQYQNDINEEDLNDQNDNNNSNENLNAQNDDDEEDQIENQNGKNGNLNENDDGKFKNIFIEENAAPAAVSNNNNNQNDSFPNQQNSFNYASIASNNPNTDGNSNANNFAENNDNDDDDGMNENSQSNHFNQQSSINYTSIATNTDITTATYNNNNDDDDINEGDGKTNEDKQNENEILSQTNKNLTAKIRKYKNLYEKEKKKNELSEARIRAFDEDEAALIHLRESSTKMRDENIQLKTKTKELENDISRLKSIIFVNSKDDFMNKKSTNIFVIDEELKKEYSRVSKENQEKTIEIEKLRSTIANLEMDMKISSNISKIKDHKSTEIEERYKLLLQQFKEIEDENLKLRKTAERKRKFKQDYIQAEQRNKELNDNLARKENDLINLKQTVEKLHKMNSDLKISQQKSTNMYLNMINPNANSDDLLTLEQARSKLTKISNEKVQKEEEIRRLKQELATQESIKDVLNRQIKALQMSEASLKEEISTKDNQILNLNEKLNDNAVQISTINSTKRNMVLVQEENDELNKTIGQLKLEINKLNEKAKTIEVLKAKLEESNDRVQKKKQKIAKLKDQIAIKDSAINQFKENIRNNIA